MLSRLKGKLLGISPHETSFAKLGIEACDDSVRERLEEVTRVFTAGYNLALKIDDAPRLADQLEGLFDCHHVGFAFEGAGMYYALRDLLAPWKIETWTWTTETRRAETRRAETWSAKTADSESRSTGRLRRFTEQVAPQHDYIATVGAGLAIARVPWGLRTLTRTWRKLDPALGWCVVDGFGFHQGLFHHQRFIERCEAPPRALPRIAHPLFDSGIGRALWWVRGASPHRIRAAIDAFSWAHRPELWCGVGVACAYACGVDDGTLHQLVKTSGCYRADLLSGVPFAARLRQKGKNPSPETENACLLLLGMTAEEAALRLVEKAEEIENGPTWSGASRRAEGYLEAYPRMRESLKADLPVGV